MATGLNYPSVPALPEQPGPAQLAACRRAPGFGRPRGEHRRGAFPTPAGGGAPRRSLGSRGQKYEPLLQRATFARDDLPRPPLWGVATCVNK